MGDLVRWAVLATVMTIASTPATADEAVGGVQLGGWVWTDGVIKRVSAPLYLVLSGNTPSDATSADVYVMPQHLRLTGPVLSVSNGEGTVASVNGDGTVSVSRGLLVGPGTGSGNVALQPQADCDGCYLALMGRLVGGGTHPARHGATTLGNAHRLGPGEYALQVKDGEHSGLWLDWQGSLELAGPHLWLGDGEPAAVHASGGLTLDAGAKDVTTHLRSGQSLTWSVDVSGCLKATVTSGATTKTYTMVPDE